MTLEIRPTLTAATCASPLSPAKDSFLSACESGHLERSLLVEARWRVIVNARRSCSLESNVNSFAIFEGGFGCFALNLIASCMLRCAFRSLSRTIGIVAQTFTADRIRTESLLRFTENGHLIYLMRPLQMAILVFSNEFRKVLNF